MINYILAKLTSRKEFRVDFMCTINGRESDSIFEDDIRRSGIKIDTGAYGTLIPLKTLGWQESEIDGLTDTILSKDINSVTILRGVESNNTETPNEIRKWPLEKIKQYKGLVLQTNVEKMNIGGLEFNNSKVRVTTSLEGNILLGMDILSQMDIHIGQSKITECTTLLACPYCSINEEYLVALEEHFNICTTISAILLNSKLHN